MNTKHSSDHDKARAGLAGFTLVEIMVVIVILGLLMTIVGTNVLGQTEKAAIDTAKMQVRNIHDAVKTYMAQNAMEIPNWEQLITPDDRGHAYMDIQEPLIDPWDNEYVITVDPDYENKALVVSYGPDKIEGSEDDITNKTLQRRKDG